MTIEYFDANQQYIAALKNEKVALEQTFPNASKLLQNEIDRLSRQDAEPYFYEVDTFQPIKIVKKVLIPKNRYPQFNFVGKIIGPGGSTLKSIAQKCKCRIFVLGQGSMKKEKEEELLATGDRKYSHLTGALHVRIETVASPAIAFERIGFALHEIKKCLNPDMHDEVSQQQLKTLAETQGKRWYRTDSATASTQSMSYSNVPAAIGGFGMPYNAAAAGFGHPYYYGHFGHPAYPHYHHPHPPNYASPMTSVEKTGGTEKNVETDDMVIENDDGGRNGDLNSAVDWCVSGIVFGDAVSSRSEVIEKLDEFFQIGFN